MTDPVKAARERARAAAEAPRAEEPPPPAPAPEPEPAKYPEGAHVSSMDPRRPAGVVAGAPHMARCYSVTPDDGSEPYMSAEEEMTPYTEPEEPPMTDETEAPEAMIAALGLAPGATLGECTAAAAAQREALARETAEAKGAALDAEGVHASLRPLVMGAMQRAEGETWTTAAARMRAEMPEAFRAHEAPAQASAPAPAPPPVPEKAAAALGGRETPKEAGFQASADPLKAHAARVARFYPGRN